MTSTDLALQPEGEPTASGATSIRALQQVGDVPVLDGVLVFTIGDAANEPRLNAVRGRAFAGLEVDPEPGLGQARAARRAEAVSGGVAIDRPDLVVVPEGGGHLAWRVTITQADEASAVAPSDGHYFVDAHSGALLSVRPASAEGRTPVRLVSRSTLAQTTAPVRALGRTPVRAQSLAADPGSVEVTGTAPTGETLTATGVRTSDGTLLVDTSVPTWDGDEQTGGIWTYSMRGSSDDSLLPGELYLEPTANGTTITDAEAIAAHALSRDVVRLLRVAGPRLVGRSGRSTSSPRSTTVRRDFCNSFFTAAPAEMVYGNPCATDEDAAGGDRGGDRHRRSRDHPRRHRHASAGLMYTGQSGALNESFSDYFGNVIGNRVKGTDSVAIFEDVLHRLSPSRPRCAAQPGRQPVAALHAQRQRLRRLLCASSTRGYRLKLRSAADSQDHGGVHFNSAIWNNALWSIRVGLAKIDGQARQRLPLAQAFDKVVYAALTTRLGPTSGFVDARARDRAGHRRLPARPGGAPGRARGLRRPRDLRRLPATPASSPATSVSIARRPSCTRRSAATASPGST